jgi:PTH1 family peptidyl-tRNA hydrolase
MQQEKLHLVVGLGNPGEKYKKTRHNAGFMVIDEVAKFYSISVDKRKFNTQYGRGFIEGIETIIAKPLSYMNMSGLPVRKLAEYFRISHENMLIVHDDIDLVFGRLKIKEKGGDGGHKGVKSLIHAFSGGDFKRLRVGIGRGYGNREVNENVTEHVLGSFTHEEEAVIDEILAWARDGVVAILCKEARDVMNIFNNKKIIISNST